MRTSRKNDGKWHYEWSQVRGVEDPIDVHEFIKDGKYLDLHETEELLNEYETLLKEAHDIMNEHNNRKSEAACSYCTGEGHNELGLVHDMNCILVKIRAKNI